MFSAAFLISVIGALQILLEPFPISSSTHVNLFIDLLKNYGVVVPEIVSTTAVDFFWAGCSLVVLALAFAPRLVPFIREWRTLFFATGVTSLLYVIFHIFAMQDYMPAFLGNLLSGLMLLTMSYRGHRSGPLTFHDAGVLGLMQGIALLPGISRLGSTVWAATMVGFSPTASFFISCALQAALFAPAACVGTLMLWKSGEISLFLQPIPLMILATSIVIAAFFLRLSKYLVCTHRWWYFGMYLVVKGCISCAAVFGLLSR